MKSAKRGSLKKIALSLSLMLIVVWAILGAGTSLAWFNDTTPKITNIFHYADFDLVVSHRLPDGTYEEIDSNTKVFDDEALYEPNYVQVVYLKVENRGDIPFDFKVAVSVSDYTPAVNAFGQYFNLQDYLRFGLVTGDTEADVENALANREMAIAAADLPLNRYDSDMAYLEAGGEAYMAIIVRMPQDVGNEANYRGSVIPRVELSVIFEATQVQH